MRERVSLEPVDGDCCRRLRALAKRQGLVGELLGLAELARRQRHHRPRSVRLPELSGDSQPVGDGARCVEIHLDSADVSHLELSHDAVEVRLHDPLGVADRVSHLEQLAPERESLGNRSRGDDGGCAAVERVGERRGVSRAPRKFDRLSAQPVAAIT